MRFWEGSGGTWEQSRSSRAAVPHRSRVLSTVTFLCHRPTKKAKKQRPGKEAVSARDRKGDDGAKILSEPTLARRDFPVAGSVLTYCLSFPCTA